MTINKTIEYIQEADEKPVKKKISGLAMAFTVIAIVVSLFAAGLSFILFQQLKQTAADLPENKVQDSADVSGRLSRLTQQVAHIKNEQKAFQAQLMTEQETFHTLARQRQSETEAMSKKLEISNQQLLQSVDVLFQQQGREHISWVLAEVEYLLLMANYSLQLKGDVKTAITALQLADKRLLHSGDPGTIDIRTQINEEIEQLKAIDPLDKVQLAASLSGRIKMIGQLPLNVTQIEEKDKVEQMIESSTSQETGELEQAGKNFLKELQSLVVLRYRDKPAQPMLTPDEGFFLRQNLQLKLETARYALLSGQQMLYEDTLNEAIQWLERYYDTEMKQVSSMLDGLGDLVAVNITAAELPNISHSINRLRVYQKEITNKPQPDAKNAVHQDEVQP